MKKHFLYMLLKFYVERTNKSRGILFTGDRVYYAHKGKAFFDTNERRTGNINKYMCEILN